MTYLPTSKGDGGAVTATIDLTNANFGSSATSWPHSPNFSTGRTSTQTDLQTANNQNIGKQPPH